MSGEDEKKTLEILIGDDEFMDITTEMIFKSDYVPMLRQKLPNYDVKVTCVTAPKRVIEEASTGRYDVVVTDLDYTGGGRGREGYDVVDAVTAMTPRPVLMLCTSSDRFEEIRQRTAGKIDYHAGCTGKGHKFGDMMEKLAEHYAK